jgi:hypothetical protein
MVIDILKGNTSDHHCIESLTFQVRQQSHLYIIRRRKKGINIYLMDKEEKS